MSYFKRYLMGYVVGWVFHDGSEVLHEKRKYRSGNKKMSVASGYVDEAVMFISPKAAEKAAKEFAKDSKAKWFYRGYSYETPNPENAKGLKEWENGMSERVYIN